MARSGQLPSLDEYVVARGPELLRTAWLLTGDRSRAQQLVEEGLATIWRHPTGAPRHGEGTLDSAARRAVVRRYVHRSARDDAPSPRPSDPDARNHVEEDGLGAPAEDLARLRRHVFEALAGLTHLQRVVVVLRCDEGLDDTHIAELLGRGLGTVRTERARGLAAMSHVPELGDADDLRDFSGADDLDDLDDPHDPHGVARRLGAALAAIAPAARAGDHVATEAITAAVHRYAARARRRRAVTVVGGLVAVLALGSLVGLTVQRDRSDALAQSPPVLTCASLPVGRATPHPGREALSTRARAALVCADRTNRSIWPGSLPPDEPISDPRGLDYLAIAPPVEKDTHCARLPIGPAFTLTVQDKDGRSETYDNVDLACNGWPTLDTYFIALGEQQAVESFNPRIDPFPPCPSILGQALRAPHVGPPGVPLGTVFTAGSACLHQSPDPTQVPAFRRPLRSVLGDIELLALTREAAAHGSGPTGKGCDDSGPAGAVVVVRVRTATGALVELTGSARCGLELLVNWSPGDYWTLTRATADAVAADFGGFPR